MTKMAPLHLISRVTDVELFAGAGGMALGLAKAGITASHLYERNPLACLTLTTNKEAGPAARLVQDARDAAANGGNGGEK